MLYLPYSTQTCAGNGKQGFSLSISCPSGASKDLETKANSLKRVLCQEQPQDSLPARLREI